MSDRDFESNEPCRLLRYCTRFPGVCAEHGCQRTWRSGKALAIWHPQTVARREAP